MPQYQTWEEFSRAAEKLYLADPMKVSRYRGLLRPQELSWYSGRVAGEQGRRRPSPSADSAPSASLFGPVRELARPDACPPALLSRC